MPILRIETLALFGVNKNVRYVIDHNLDTPSQIYKIIPKLLIEDQSVRFNFYFECIQKTKPNVRSIEQGE